jgi:pimeloyl-ACP methyl ester carboxylesterase
MIALVRDVDGGEFAWREAGESGGDAVVFLHGLGGSRLAWDAQLAALADGYRCVAWDAPGYGGSAPLPEPLSFASLRAAVGRFLDVLHLDAAHLVGLSFGGMICQYVAALDGSRVRSLAVLSSSAAFGLDGTQPETWRATRLAPLEAGLEPADFAEQVLRSIAGPSLTEDALEGQRRAMSRVSGRAFRAAVECVVTHDARPLLHRITAPTLVLVGALDAETPPAYAEAIARAVAGARIVVVPGAGHLLPAEAPGAVNRHLRDHLRLAAAAGVAARGQPA